MIYSIKVKTFSKPDYVKANVSRSQLIKDYEGLKKSTKDSWGGQVDFDESDLDNKYNRGAYDGLKEIRDKRLGISDIGENYTDPHLEDKFDRSTYNRTIASHTKKLKEMATKDRAQYIGSLGILPKYNPLGYVGRGIGALANKIAPHQEVVLSNEEIDSPEYTQRAQDNRNSAYRDALLHRSRLLGKKKGNLMLVGTHNDVDRSIRYHSDYE